MPQICFSIHLWIVHYIKLLVFEIYFGLVSKDIDVNRWFILLYYCVTQHAARQSNLTT